MIDEFGISLDANILDLGTSTGTNLRLLKNMGFTHYQGLDFSDEAIRWCAEKELGYVQKGDICNIPFNSAEFSLVLATDIIEHVDDDMLALKEIKRILKPDGVAIITVPAFQFLWGHQDIVSHHKRRYLINEVRKKLGKAGLNCEEIFYFNYFMFLPIWLARMLIRLFHINVVSENQINSPLLNSIMTKAFMLDIWSARKIRPPFGVSILAIVRPFNG